MIYMYVILGAAMEYRWVVTQDKEKDNGELLSPLFVGEYKSINITST